MGNPIKSDKDIVPAKNDLDQHPIAEPPQPTRQRMMASKAGLPLYHSGKDRPRFSRRRYNSSARNSRRQNDGGSCAVGSRCLGAVIICPLLLFVFGAGILLGVELSQVPAGGGGNGDVSNRGGKSGRHGPSAPLPSGSISGSVTPPAPGGGVNVKLPSPRSPYDGLGDVGGGRGGLGKGSGSAVSGSEANSIEGKWLKRNSFHARRGAYVTVKESLDEEEEVTAAAWIRLDDNRMSDIKTILGNKMSGCGSDALGFALFVNDWEKDDGQLWLEWGDGSSGCQKIHSNVKVPKGQWVHVAARFRHDEITIFMQGKEVASAAGNRRPGSREEFAVGAFSPGDYPFEGRIGAVAVFGSALTDEHIKILGEESGTKPLATAVGCSSLPAVEDCSLMIAMQLDESVDSEKDGTQVSHLGRASDEKLAEYHFEKSFHVDKELKDGLTPHEVTQAMKEESDRVGAERAKEVKAAMQHAWEGYRKYAWGADELAPRGKRGKHTWGNMGTTLVDSLDTLWLMDMKKEFWDARDWVRDKLSFAHAGSVSVFETTIRELGGLLSAYDLSQDEVFKRKAQELGDLLLPAFDTLSGIPSGQVNFRTGRNSGSRSVLAEVGTLQVEFRYLSKITGDRKYADKANRVFEIMSKQEAYHGLYPIYVSTSSGKPVGKQVTFGALGDSFYEYLLKVWLQGGKKEAMYRKMYDAAMDGMTEVLLKRSDPHGLTYVSDWNGHSNEAKMDHLVCFVAGTLALGAQTTDDTERADRDLKTAKALAYTCYQMYKRQKTGLAPEMVRFQDGKDMVVPHNTAYNILRPETAEALFVLHQVTGDPIYRDWSYEIFQAFERYCKLPVAYGSYPDVNNVKAQPEDRMESFFLAETLKYLYLIQVPDHTMDLSKYVFNTEAHPTRIFDVPVETA